MPTSSDTASRLLDAAQELRDAVNRLRFAAPVTHVYNPLDYAWENYSAYIRRFAGAPRDIIFLGMNPGPWGMAQTGIPFGVVWASRDWMQLPGQITKPAIEHSKRPVLGHACPRTEVSGDRLWSWARDKFKTPERFSARACVLNYCPLSFMEESGRNFVPEKLPRFEREPLFDACDLHLRRALEVLQPRYAIGVGKFAEARLTAAVASQASSSAPNIGVIPHPSPANPAANAGWGAAMESALKEMGIKF